VLRSIYGTRGDEMEGGWRRHYNDDFMIEITSVV
jgi:hypothetical protein